jgi:hypothetical protein
MQLDGSTVSWAIPKGLLGMCDASYFLDTYLHMEVSQSGVSLADWLSRRLCTLSAILYLKVRIVSLQSILIITSRR